MSSKDPKSGSDGSGAPKRPADPTVEPDAHAPVAPTEKKAKKPGRWWRRIKWTLITVIALAILLRIALGFALPLVVSGVASTLGMDAHYDHMSLSLTGGEARVWNLRVIPKDPAISGGEPVFTANYLRGDISPLALLQGRLVVWRAEADTLELRLERRADGSVPLLDLVLASLPARERDPEPVPLSFTAPLAVDALRLNRVRAHIKDDAVQPPLDTTIDLNVHVSKVGPDAPPTEVEIDIFAPGLLDVLKIRALATARERELDSSFNVELFGLRPGALAGYLVNFGLRPAAEEIGARMTGTLKTTAVAGDDRAIDTLLVLENIVCTEDGTPDLKVQQVRLEAPYVGPAGVDGREVLIEGVRFAARRTEEGVIHVLGAEFAAPRRGAGAARVLSSEGRAPGEADVPSPATQPAPMSFKLAQFNVRDLSMTVIDQAIAPPARVTADLLGFSVRDLAWPPESQDAALPFEATLTAPGVARSASASGEVRPYGDVMHLAATLAADGIVASVAEPYLRAAGIEALLQEGYFKAEVEASLDTVAGDRPRVSARLRDVSFTEGTPEGGRALALMPEVNVGGLALFADGTLRVDELTMRGPALDIRLEPDGAITAAGFRRLPAIAAPNAEGDESGERPALRQGAVAALVKAIDLGRVTWEEIDLTVTDATVDPPIVMSIADAGVLVSDLRIDLMPPVPGADAARAGTVAVRLRAPELIERFEAQGTLSAAAGTLDAQIDFTAEGVTLAALRGLLARGGIEPQWDAANLAGSLAARATAQEGAMLPRLDLGLQGVTLTDGEAELAGVDGLSIKQFIASADGSMRIEAFEATRPRIRGSRRADGSLVLAGVRFAPLADEPLARAAAERLAAAQAGGDDEPPAPVFPFAPLVLPPVAVGGVKVTEASITFTDEMRPETGETSLSADLEVGRFDTIDAAAPETPFTVVVRGPGLDSLRASGSLSARPDEQRIVADVSANGVDGAAVARLLPPGVELAVSDGALRLRAEAQLRPGIAAGGLAANLALSDFDWRDPAAEAPLASMQSLSVQVDRFDLAGRAIDIAHARIAGLSGAAVLGADGVPTVSGIRLPPQQGAVEEQEQLPAAGAPAADGAAAQELPTTKQDAAEDAAQVRAALAGAAKAVLPRVVIQELDLHLAQFAITHESRPAAAPLVLQDVRLTNPQPIVLDPEADESAAPTELAITGAIEPVVGDFRADVRSQPFARSPTLNLSLRAQGIRGEGLVELVPELAQNVDATGLTDGRFALDLEGRFDVQRRGGIPDLASGIGGELLVRDIAFRNGEDGPVLLGLEELEAERIRFEPQSGGLVIGALELRTPRARMALDDRGIHAAGLVVLLGTQGEQAPPEDGAEAEGAELAAAQAAAGAPATAESQPAEVGIDSLRVSGLDFVFEDRTFDPPLVAPINSLDVDVRGLSNRLATEPRTLRFSVMANSGQVELPKPPEGSGIIGAIGDLGGDAKPEAETEMRDLFAQFSTSGRVQLYPAPDGRLTLSLTGLELLCLRGLAQKQGVVIGNGVLDVSADLKLNADRTIDVRSKSALTSLRVSEPANGPIYRYLRLPAPLDTVIVTIQDAGGTITLPVSVTVEQGQIGNGELVPAVAAALSQVIATAVVQSPVKVAGGAMNLIGISGRSRGTARHRYALSFAPGSTQLDATSVRRLAQARGLMADNAQAQASIRHRLGAEDVLLVARRANPSPYEALAVAARLRAQRDELLDERAQPVGHARSAVAFGSADEAATASDALRAADAHAAQLDQAIDASLEMLSPGAARRADRRTRTTAISLGQQRLEIVESLLGAGKRAQKANAQFDPPSGSEAEGEPGRPAGGVIEIEIVYPRRGRGFVPYVPFL